MFETKDFGGEEPAIVEVSLGLTVNLGNFESARLDVGIRVPCRPEEAQETFEKAKQWCEDQVQKEVRAIRNRG